MPEIKNVGGKIRYSVEHFDGGLNTNDAPSKIGPKESPDCQNVVFDEIGAVKTRNGSYWVHSTQIVSMVSIETLDSLTTGDVYGYWIEDASSYDGNIILWTSQHEVYETTGIGGGVTLTPESPRMWRSISGAGSGVTNQFVFTEVTAASGKFRYGSSDEYPACGRKPHIVYQDLLFFSDGYNTWKYGGSESLYKMGISYDVSAPAVATTTSGGTQLIANTYYYAVSHENTQVVEGQIGEVTSGVVVPASGSVKVTGIPTPSTVDGINKMYVYRAESSSGPFRRLTSVIELPASTTTESIGPTITSVFDNTPVGQEGRLAITDGGAPVAFSTVALHKERLFFNDITDLDNASFMWWSNYTNPFIVEALNFDVVNKGDGEYISRIISQDDVLTIFKQSKGWGYVLQDPSDQLTWVKKEHPANIGLYSPNAAVRVQNGIFFLGRKENKVTGFHFLSGLQIVESFDGKLRSLTVSSKIEETIVSDFPEITPFLSYTGQVLTSGTPAGTGGTSTDFGVSLMEYKNRIYCIYHKDVSNEAVNNNRILWFDLGRLNINDPEGIGSWSIWKGPLIGGLFNHNGSLYGYDHAELDSSTVSIIEYARAGCVRQYELEDFYRDNTWPIDSYFYTKEFGGSESSIESYFKDLKSIYVWYKQLGDYKFNIYARRDGDDGIGQKYTVGMTGDTVSAWGSAVFGSSFWGDSLITSSTDRIPMGGLMGRRFQFRFDNQNTVDQGFQVNRLEMDFNVRRRR